MGAYLEETELLQFGAATIEPTFIAVFTEKEIA